MKMKFSLRAEKNTNHKFLPKPLLPAPPPPPPPLFFSYMYFSSSSSSCSPLPVPILLFLSPPPLLFYLPPHLWRVLVHILCFDPPASLSLSPPSLPLATLQSALLSVLLLPSSPPHHFLPSTSSHPHHLL